MSMFKKIVLLIFTFTVLFPLLPKTVNAQASTWYDQSFKEWFIKVYDEDHSPETEIFGERYTAAQVQWILYSIAAIPFTHTKEVSVCVLQGGQDLNACADAVKKLIAGVPVNNNLADVNAKDIFLGRSMSGIGYIKDVASKFNIVKEVHAQTGGYGYDTFIFLRPFWITFRNISYTFFVIITLVFAFMIMFRVKISPQTVISVQTALPKIILGIILVTFSYAIAGFMFDLMYVAIGLVSAFFTATGVFGNNYSAIYAFLSGNQTSLFWYWVLYYLLFLLTFLFAAFATIIAAGSNIALAPVLLVFYVLIIFLLLIALFWYVFKITWMLIKTFASIMMLIMFSPLYITVGTLSSTGGFTTWLKSLGGNLAVFPVTGFLLVMSFYFLIVSLVLSVGAAGLPIVIVEYILTFIGTVLIPGFATPTLPSVTGVNMAPLPLLGGGMVPLVFLGASFAVLAMAPRAAEVIKSFIEGKPFGYGTAIGQALTVAAMPVTALVSKSYGMVSGGIEKGIQTRIANRITPRP